MFPGPLQIYLWHFNPGIGYNFKDGTRKAQREMGVREFEMFNNGPVQCVLLLTSPLYIGYNILDDSEPEQPRDPHCDLEFFISSQQNIALIYQAASSHVL